MKPQFRAWHKKKKVMGEVELLAHNSNGWLVMMDGVTLGVKERDCVLEQWSGLRDCNGRRIYEGDLLVNETDPLKEVAAVYWDEKYAMFGIRWRRGDVLNLRPFYEIVVGNIHENPELLEGLDYES